MYQTPAAPRALVPVCAAFLSVLACNDPRPSAENANIGTHWESLTGVEATNAAQRGFQFVIPDVAHWVQSHDCVACHRAGAPLFGGSLAAHNGLTVDTSGGFSNGTHFGDGLGYIAARIAGEQCPPAQTGYTYFACNSTSSSQPGYWSEHPSLQLRFSKGSYALWGLAGYTHFSGSTQYLSQVRRGVDWIRFAVTGGDYNPADAGTRVYAWSYALPIASSPPYSYRYSFPNDGLPHGGRTTYFVPLDVFIPPTLSSWIQPTAMVASATALLVVTDPTLTQVQRDDYIAFLNSLADSIEGQYVRGGAVFSLVDLVYTMIGLHAAGRRPSSSALAAQVRDDIMSRFSINGWGDPVRGAPNNPLSTGQAIYALCLAGVRLDAAPIINTALDTLAGEQAPDGSWSVANLAPDIPSTFASLGMACYGILNVEATTTTNGATAAPSSGTSQNISFGISVTNTGYVTNTYSIDPSGCVSGCSLSANPPALTLEPGQTGTSQIEVVLPPGIPASSLIPITVTTSYTASNGLAQNTAVVNIVAGDLPGATALATTTTWVAGAGETISAGDTLALRASVTRAAGAVTEGTLTFYYGSIAIGTVFADPVTGAYAYDWSIPVTLQGNQSISAVYGGYKDGGLELAGSASTGTLLVNVLPPPAAPVIATPIDGFVTDSNLVRVTASGSAGALLTIRAGASNVATLTVPAGAVIDTDVTLSYGVFSLTFVQTHSGGTSPEAGPRAVTVRPPPPAIAQPANGFQLSHLAPSVSIIGNGEANAAIAVYDDIALVASLTADPAGNFSGSINLAIGGHALTFTQTVNGATGDATTPITGRVTADSDGDGLDDNVDNCRVFNPDQVDQDADGRGNVCDNCPFAANADQADADGDGTGDACDANPAVAKPSNDGSGVANPQQSSTITTGNGAATVTLPAGFIAGTTPTTVTISGQSAPPDFRVMTTSGAGGVVIIAYDVTIGISDPYYPPAGRVAAVSFVVPYAPFATPVNNNNIAVAVREPNNTFIMIPNCNATSPNPNTSADGRCTQTTIFPNAFGQQAVRVETTAFHF